MNSWELLLLILSPVTNVLVLVAAFLMKRGRTGAMGYPGPAGMTCEGCKGCKGTDEVQGD